MLITAASIVVAWAVLFGAAYLARFRAGLGKARSIAITAAAYAALSSLSLGWFGLNQTGFLGAFGMLLPCTAAVGLVLVSPAKR